MRKRLYGVTTCHTAAREDVVAPECGVTRAQRFHKLDLAHQHPTMTHSKQHYRLHRNVGGHSTQYRSPAKATVSRQTHASPRPAMHGRPQIQNRSTTPNLCDGVAGQARVTQRLPAAVS